KYILLLKATIVNEPVKVHMASERNSEFQSELV
ncbi:MAG: hypothetical protein ACI86M_002107, partial [Saprospiraceae bacterium]